MVRLARGDVDRLESLEGDDRLEELSDLKLLLQKLEKKEIDLSSFNAKEIASFLSKKAKLQQIVKSVEHRTNLKYYYTMLQAIKSYRSEIIKKIFKKDEWLRGEDREYCQPSYYIHPEEEIDDKECDVNQIYCKNEFIRKLRKDIDLCKVIPTKFHTSLDNREKVEKLIEERVNVEILSIEREVNKIESFYKDSVLLRKLEKSPNGRLVFHNISNFLYAGKTHSESKKVLVDLVSIWRDLELSLKFSRKIRGGDVSKKVRDRAGNIAVGELLFIVSDNRKNASDAVEARKYIRIPINFQYEREERLGAGNLHSETFLYLAIKNNLESIADSLGKEIVDQNSAKIYRMLVCVASERKPCDYNIYKETKGCRDLLYRFQEEKLEEGKILLELQHILQEKYNCVFPKRGVTMQILVGVQEQLHLESREAEQETELVLDIKYLKEVIPCQVLPNSTVEGVPLTKRTSFLSSGMRVH